nr:MAG TPA: hypothetical protein [Caudoviricetes sp.]
MLLAIPFQSVQTQKKPVQRIQAESGRLLKSVCLVGLAAVKTFAEILQQE